MLARLFALVVVLSFAASTSLGDGVCCTDCGGTCTLTANAANCAQLGGTYLGDGTVCTPLSCVYRACCEETNCGCTLVLNTPCPAGAFDQGANSCCTPDPCAFEACCGCNGSCFVVFVSSCGLGTTGQGPNSCCTPNPCAITRGTLIFGPNVGGPPRPEETAALAAGYGPVTLVNAATWATLSAAEFRCYRLIVIGESPEGYIDQVIAATSCIWAPCRTGNGIIMGTDPVSHQSSHPGAAALITAGITFAGHQSNKTGLYVSLSHQYEHAGANTPALELSGLCSGCPSECFTVQAVPPETPGDYLAHVVATAPGLILPTDADLTNWHYSVHEVFNSWPTDWIPLAVAVVDGPPAPGGPFEYPCYPDQPAPPCPAPSYGLPYILATGEIYPAARLCACCPYTAPGSCISTNAVDCAARNGVFLANLVCSPSLCLDLGACCLGTNCALFNPLQCQDFGGVFDGATCFPNPCDGPTGACCGPCDCVVTSPAACTGRYAGNDTACFPDPCNPGFIGACCVAAAACFRDSLVGCTDVSGTFQGPGTTCSPGRCDPPNPCQIIGHFASTDPLDEGWQAIEPINGGYANPFTDNIGAGYAVWRVGSTTGNGNAFYSREFTAPELAQMEGGWAVSATLRVASTTTPGGSPVGNFLEYDTNTRRYQIVASLSGGNTLLRVRTGFGPGTNEIPGEDFLLPGSGYHDVEMRWNPSSQAFDIWADARLLKTGYDGFAGLGAPYQFQWGWGQPAIAGEGFWRSVFIRLFPAFQTQPASALACPTGSAPFVATGAGPGPFTYQWQVATGFDTWADLSSIPQALPCGGPSLISATAPNASQTSIAVTPCNGNPGVPQQFRIRCTITSAAGCTGDSHQATYTVCPADINCSGALSVQDIFDFLAAYFAGSLSADFNHSGALSVQDIFDFLAAYFAGCA